MVRKKSCCSLLDSFWMLTCEFFLGNVVGVVVFVFSSCWWKVFGMFGGVFGLKFGGGVFNECEKESGLDTS